jgi:hypothetical protein
MKVNLEKLKELATLNARLDEAKASLTDAEKRIYEKAAGVDDVISNIHTMKPGTDEWHDSLHTAINHHLNESAKSLRLSKKSPSKTGQRLHRIAAIKHAGAAHHFHTAHLSSGKAQNDLAYEGFMNHQSALDISKRAHAADKRHAEKYGK